MKQPNLLFRCRFGSHLYGTDTPSSDTDYKGIFLPTPKQVITQSVPKSLHTTTGTNRSKNSPEDTDEEIYSLHYFLTLAGKGETVALDMLHCPTTHTLTTSEEWQFIRTNRQRFYTRTLRAYVGYCRGQAAKYGIKGSRLDDCRRVVEFLTGREGKLAEFWDELPTGEHIRKYEEENSTQTDRRMYEVCSRKVPVTASVQYVRTVFQKYFEAYGARAHLAAENKGIDWKAISHAFRGGFQLKEILLTGDLKYPLRDRDFLKLVKAGAFHYQNDGIGQQLDELVEEIFALSEASGLPKNVDMGFWEDFLVGLYLKGGDWRLPGLTR